MKHYLLTAILISCLAFFGTTSLSSCNKTTCPTYATSGPSKSVKSKGNAPYSKKAQKKSKKGGPVPGLNP
jgi:hypothetical protein